MYVQQYTGSWYVAIYTTRLLQSEVTPAPDYDVFFLE